MANITLGADAQDFVFERNDQSDTITDFRSFYFAATLDEAQEVPPNTDIAGIDGTGTGSLDFARQRFEFALDINGIDLAGGTDPDDMTDMHIHGGAVGVAGPIIFDFRNDAETVVDAVAGTVTGGWDADEAAALDMTPANVAALLAGETYFNIHTNRDTSGWIRGQIERDGAAGDRIDLSALNIGSFETLRAITTQAGGDAVIRTFFDGEISTLRLDGVSEAALRPGHFIFAGDVDETSEGTAERDDLFGAGGGDILLGRLGNDRLFGEDDDDTLSGGRDRDALSGGLGLDILRGGLGGDRFVFRDVDESAATAALADRVDDFLAGTDAIVLAPIDAAAGLAGNQAFSFIGDAAFDGEGQARVAGSPGGDTIVFLNTTGSNGAEMAIWLEGDIELGEQDFLL